MKKLILLLITAITMSSVIAQTTAVNESFETWPAPDWNNYIYEEGGWVHSLIFGSDLGYGGGNCAKHKIENDAVNDWLVSPQIQVVGSDYQLTFYEKSESLQYYTYAGVHISTGSGNPADGEFIELSESMQVEDSWVEHVVDLSIYNGENIYIAFVFQGPENCWHQWNVDEVVIASTSLIDGALTQIVNPTGINPIPSTEDVIVTLHNYGTNNINDADIEWYVNDVQQTTYQATNLNLAPGGETDITVGIYDFAIQGDYLISLNLLLSGDSNPGNDTIQGIYYVTDPKDAALTNIDPEGYYPATGSQDVHVTVLNEGDFTINDLAVEWEVNGISQDDYQINSIEFEPGEEIELTIGQYDFSEGLSEITATVIVSGDEDISNNTNISHVAVNILWESFEGSRFTPEMWSADDYPLIESFFPAPQGELYYTAMTDNNIFGEISDTLFTPLLEIENGDVINFWVNNSQYFTNDDKLIWKDGTTGEIHLIGDIDSELEQWDDVSIDISSAAGINYIGIVNNNNGSYGISNIDLITSSASIHHFDYDLGISDFNFEIVALKNESHTFNVSLRNYGLNDIDGSAYTIKLMTEAGEQLTEQSGVTLQSWEKVIFEINYTFTELENLKVYAIIDYSSDEYLMNDRSEVYAISSVPSNIEVTDIGFAEAENLNIPFDTGGDTWTLDNADISQHIYYQDELNTDGYIYGVTLYYHELMAVGQYLPLQVWLKGTDLDDLSGGWIPTDEMQMVFNDTIEVYPGQNSVYIPFDEPVFYAGTNNLAIQYYQDEPEWPYTACRFYATNASGPVRAISLLNAYQLDPNDPPDYWDEHTEFTYTSFIFQPATNEGVISGTVFDENNNPVQSATVTIETISLTETTNEYGEYIFPEIPYDTYQITTSFFGYNDLTQTMVLDEPTETLDFYLEPLPLVSVYGEVFGSNAPGVPLEDVLVTIDGYDTYSTYTNDLGEFMFENVYGNNEYDITFQFYGYHDHIDVLTLEGSDLDLGSIILDEEFISAYNVMATANGNEALIEWTAPGASQKTKLQNDQDTVSYSYTNEPNENVWLGNLFENDNHITLTSVEVYWDIYENAHDFVAIDILDYQGNLLVSSQPFLTHHDSLMTIDIPNIFIEDDFYAMVHWQNNPISTDALVIDWSQDVPNTAYIMYPGENPMLFSDFIGSPNGSWFVRVNVLEDGSGKGIKEALSYNIYKGFAEDIDEVDEWPALNTEPVTNLTFTDDNWTGGVAQVYTYAIEAVYTEGEAEYSFSNFIELITNITETETDNVAIYPNPASSTIFIDGVDEGTITIYNMIGKIVHSETIATPTTQIDVSYLKNGNYFIRTTGAQDEIVKKLVIAK